MDKNGKILIETVDTDRFRMRFFRCGRGERTYVILPGLSVQGVMGAAEAIAEAYAFMEDEFTIYVFDRREDVPPVYTVEDMARDTAAAFRILGLKDICLFGASQGGMMAQVIAIEEPDLIERLVLGSTASHEPVQEFGALEKWIGLAEQRDRTGLYLEFGRQIFPPEVFEQQKEALAAAAETVTDEELDRFIIMANGVKGFDVTGRLDRISCPVLIMGVYEDAVLGSDATMEIAEKLDEQPGFRLFMYIGYGHAAYDTAPDYRQRIWKFLTDRRP